MGEQRAEAGMLFVRKHLPAWVLSSRLITLRLGSAREWLRSSVTQSTFSAPRPRSLRALGDVYIHVYSSDAFIQGFCKMYPIWLSFRASSSILQNSFLKMSFKKYLRNQEICLGWNFCKWQMEKHCVGLSPEVFSDQGCPGSLCIVAWKQSGGCVRGWAPCLRLSH